MAKKKPVEHLIPTNPTIAQSLGPEVWKRHLITSLQEDQWNLDWTSRGTAGLARGNVAAQVISRSGGIWAGAGLFEAIAAIQTEWGFQTKVTDLCADGSRLKADARVVSLQGDAYSVLVLERSLLNLSAFVSGIATATKKLVDQVKQSAEAARMNPTQFPRVTATRKTLPGFRDLSLYGVMVGGGFSHRVNLAGGVLIKENHIACAGGDIAKAIAGVRAVAPHGLLIEVEVRNQKELNEACAAGAEAVLLDNYSPSAVRSAVAGLRKNYPQIKVEVSGGLNEKNIGEYVMPGVHVLSSGSLTHSVKAMDLSLLFKVEPSR